MSNPDYYPVVGRKDTGANYDRLSIQELQSNHPYQFTLFILAFLVIQERPLTDPQSPLSAVFLENPAGSFGAIASIHGKPYQEWIGDKRKELEKIADFNSNDRKDTGPVPSRFGGVHGAVSFPPWHRSYLLLLEQIIGTIAEKLAQALEQSSAGERNLWVPAARQLRFPYWDWAAEDVPNPLSYYPFVGEIPPDFQDVVREVRSLSY
ncbi:hypothetical protein SERLA73DRAFT_59891 [Serpula lacrymans var. lacrymans S7.3]|uniref:Tyrosinase copper-binding domain-containing protein n=1 Tax=Serpula lacrymans var. lacrymans (strain S7.3) TaxID=936435 RepID=F8Q849_SERL3|nr:hypothetical protein SERLA73DRAFT_59891 [Serpula lacrymans var. lacrymans S7.3]